MKKISIIILTIILSANLNMAVSASTVTDTFNDFNKGLEEESKDILKDEDSASDYNGFEGIVLEDYQDDEQGQAVGEAGVRGITGAIFTFLDFFKLIVAPIAVLMIVFMGVRMVTAGKENDQVMTNAKNYMSYGIEGLLIIFISDTVIRKVFFGTEGEIFRNGEAGAQDYALKAADFFAGIYTLIQALIAVIAVFILITAGMRFVAGSLSSDEVTKAKKQITWSAVGLFVIAVSEFVVKDILFRNKGTTLGLEQAKTLLAQITNFAAGTIGTLSFAFLLYAGYLYVASAGNEDNVSKAKKIMTGAAIGILLAGAAFAITNTIVELNSSR